MARGGGASEARRALEIEPEEGRKGRREEESERFHVEVVLREIEDDGEVETT